MAKEIRDKLSSIDEGDQKTKKFKMHNLIYRFETLKIVDAENPHTQPTKGYLSPNSPI